MTASAEPTDITQWIGRTESADDLIAPWPVAALNATLDRDDPYPADGDALPALYHWLYFLPLARTGELDVDGHPRRGGFLPPVTLPRRMWASSDVSFEGALRVGERVRRTATIANVAEKSGRTGPLVFVDIRYELTGRDGRVTDTQTVVYREAPKPGEPAPAGKPAPVDARFSRSVRPTAPLLFRYSALIFNAHRIHYDQPYATGEEGYPGLVVHGPLIATLLADLVRRQMPERAMTRFRFRAMKPLFDTAPFAIQGRADDEGAVRLWASDAAGDLCTEAKATLA